MWGSIGEDLWGSGEARQAVLSAECIVCARWYGEERGVAAVVTVGY